MHYARSETIVNSNHESNQYSSTDPTYTICTVWYSITIGHQVFLLAIHIHISKRRTRTRAPQNISLLFQQGITRFNQFHGTFQPMGREQNDTNMNPIQAYSGQHEPHRGRHDPIHCVILRKLYRYGQSRTFCIAKMNGTVNSVAVYLLIRLPKTLTSVRNTYS